MIMKITDTQLAGGSRRDRDRREQHSQNEERPGEKMVRKAARRIIAPERFAAQDASRKHGANFRQSASR